MRRVQLEGKRLSDGEPARKSEFAQNPSIRFRFISLTNHKPRPIVQIHRVERRRLRPDHSRLHVFFFSLNIMLVWVEGDGEVLTGHWGAEPGSVRVVVAKVAKRGKRDVTPWPRQPC